MDAAKPEGQVQPLPPFGTDQTEPSATEHGEEKRLSVKHNPSVPAASHPPKTPTPTRLSVDDRRKRALAKRQQQQAFATSAVGDMMDAARRQSLLSPTASFAMDSASSQEGRRLRSQSRTLSFSIPDTPGDKTFFDQNSPRVPRKSPSMTPFAPLLHRDLSSALESVGSASLSAQTERGPPSVIVSPTPQKSTKTDVDDGKAPTTGAAPDVQSTDVQRGKDAHQIASAPPTVPPQTLRKVDSLRLQSHESGEILRRRVARSPSSLSLLSKHSAELFRSPSPLKRPASLHRRESDPTVLLKTPSIEPREVSHVEAPQLRDSTAAPQHSAEHPVDALSAVAPSVRDAKGKVFDGPNTIDMINESPRRGRPLYEVIDTETAIRETTLQSLKDAERKIDGIHRQATEKSQDLQITRIEQCYELCLVGFRIFQETTHPYTPYQIECLVRLQSWWRGRLTRIMITAALIARNTEYGLLPQHQRYLQMPFLSHGNHCTDPPSADSSTRRLRAAFDSSLTKTGTIAFVDTQRPFISPSAFPAMQRASKSTSPCSRTRPKKLSGDGQRDREGPKKASAWPRTLVRTLCDFLDTLETAPHRCSRPFEETGITCSDGLLNRQSWYRNNGHCHPAKNRVAPRCYPGARQFSCPSRHGTSTITGIYNYHSERQSYPPFAFALEKRVLRQLQKSRLQRQAIARSWLCDPRDASSDPNFARSKEVSFFLP